MIDLFLSMNNIPKELWEFSRVEAKLWTFHPIYRDNKIIAFFVTKDNKIHCACLPEYKAKWFRMKMFKQLVTNILSKYSCVETTTFLDTYDFVTRLGFKEVSRMNNTINYIKTEI